MTITKERNLGLDDAPLVAASLERLAAELAPGAPAEWTFLDVLDGHADESYVISYLHPVLPGRSWVRVAGCDETRRFLSDVIHPDRDEGLDLVVAPEDLRFILVFHHDGVVRLLAE